MHVGTEKRGVKRLTFAIYLGVHAGRQAGMKEEEEEEGGAVRDGQKGR